MAKASVRNADVTTDDIFAILAGDMMPQDIHDRRRERQARREAALLQRKIEADYRRRSTRELLAILSAFRMLSELDDPERDASWWAVRKVLATREHVPGKSEERVKRQFLAKRQHGKGKSRDR